MSRGLSGSLRNGRRRKTPQVLDSQSSPRNSAVNSDKNFTFYLYLYLLLQGFISSFNIPQEVPLQEETSVEVHSDQSSLREPEDR